ncbi:DUF6292 family protein [Streptomyces sp. NPDC003860]
MIRAGRRHLVRTLADLAQQQGAALQTYLNNRPYAAPGFPEPISAPGARTRLYDGDQVDAYLTGRPIPPLPTVDDDQDLLDRREAAAVLGVAPRSWDTYKHNPQLTKHKLDVGGVEHWPRGTVQQFKDARPGKPTETGRPQGAGDQVPREQLLARTTSLLEANPAITSADVVQQLGVHRDTAQDALTHLRANAMADLMHADTTLTPRQAAHALGYPAGQVRRAAVRAQSILRARTAAPYLVDVAQELHRQEWTTTDAPPAVLHPTDDVCAAVVILDTPQAPAPALVWDERHGWRTTPSRRHPLGRAGTWPPPGPGIRYLAAGTTPTPAALVAALT